MRRAQPTWPSRRPPYLFVVVDDRIAICRLVARELQRVQRVSGYCSGVVRCFSSRTAEAYAVDRPRAGHHERTSGLYLIRCGSSASGPRLGHPWARTRPPTCPRTTSSQESPSNERMWALRHPVEEPAVVGASRRRNPAKSSSASSKGRGVSTSRSFASVGLVEQQHGWPRLSDQRLRREVHAVAPRRPREDRPSAASAGLPPPALEAGTSSRTDASSAQAGFLPSSISRRAGRPG